MRRLLFAWQIFREALTRWSDDQCGTASAAMSYYAACSLFPLCLVLTSLLGLVLSVSSGAAEAQQQLLGVISRQASPWLADQLTNVLQSVADQAHTGGPWGGILLLAGAISMFHQLDTFIERLWKHTSPEPSGIWLAVRRAVTSRLTAFLVLLGLGALLVVMLALDSILLVWQAKVEVAPLGKWIWSLGQNVLTMLTSGLLLTLLFKTLPPMPVCWTAALAGGFFTAAVWKLGQRLLAALLIGDNYSPYGVIGAFLAVMLWLYYSSAVLFLGAEITWVVQQQKAEGERLKDEG